MVFNKHLELAGKHAFLSASSYHWLNYSPDKVDIMYSRWMAKELGSKYHEYAKRAIELGIRQANTKRTINMYINDAIGYRMHTEQPLYYSENAFGTADAIAYDHKKKTLRIHDLKSGVVKASMSQLEIYAALFCLEYKVSPMSLNLIELRIYQNDAVIVHTPAPEHIRSIMDKIIMFDERIDKLKNGGI